MAEGGVMGYRPRGDYVVRPTQNVQSTYYTSSSAGKERLIKWNTNNLDRQFKTGTVSSWNIFTRLEKCLHSYSCACMCTEKCTKKILLVIHTTTASGSYRDFVWGTQTFLKMFFQVSSKRLDSAVEEISRGPDPSDLTSSDLTAWLERKSYISHFQNVFS